MCIYVCMCIYVEKAYERPYASLDIHSLYSHSCGVRKIYRQAAAYSAVYLTYAARPTGGGEGRFNYIDR